MTVLELYHQLEDLIEQGHGDLPLIRDYEGDLFSVDTLEVRQVYEVQLPNSYSPHFVRHTHPSYGPATERTVLEIS